MEDNDKNGAVVGERSTSDFDEEGGKGSNERVDEGKDEQGVKVDDQEFEGGIYEDDEGYHGDIDEEGVTNEKREIRYMRRRSGSKRHKHRDN